MNEYTEYQDKAALAGLNELRSQLVKMPSGSLSDEAAGRVMKLLAPCWNQFEGSDTDSTWAYKLKRAESVEWNPPTLTFVLERHGGTALGSTRAELHKWFVDIDKRSAEMAVAGRRQLYPMDLPFTKKTATKLAIEIVGLIRKGKKDDRLKWYADGTVSVILNKCVEARFKQTRNNRTRIFSAQLIPMLEAAGWAFSGRAIGLAKPTLDSALQTAEQDLITEAPGSKPGASNVNSVSGTPREKQLIK